MPASPTLEGLRRKLKAHEKKIPQPDELHARLQNVYDKHKDLLVKYTKLHDLFMTGLHHAQAGCLSDPTTASLIRKDRFGVLRSCRGTNISESHHKASFPAHAYGPFTEQLTTFRPSDGQLAVARFGSGPRSIATTCWGASLSLAAGTIAVSGRSTPSL